MDALPVRFSDMLIAADKRGERNGFGRGEGRIPPGAVLHRLDGLAVGILIFIGGSLSDKLLAGLRMLALAESREVLGGDRSSKAELRSKPALPFACNHATLRPIVLLLGGELLLRGRSAPDLRKAAWKSSAWLKSSDQSEFTLAFFL